MSKGLSFSPNYSGRAFDTKVDLFRFYRSLHLKVWYHQNPYNTAARSTSSESEPNRPCTPFRVKSTFSPCVNNSTLATFTKKVSYEVERIFEPTQKKRQYNLTKKEHDALTWLSNRTDIIIKSADKGGAVCVWGKEKYVTEALRQLTNTEYYSMPASNPMDNMKRELSELLDNAKTQNWISKKEYEFLIYQTPRIPSFYMLPKVHKNLENPPGRPIISGNDSITEPASKFVDYFIKPFVSELPSYIQDSNEVLQKINQMANIGSCIMATMDVESLYSNIVHEEGLEALRYYLGNRREDQMPPTDFIIQLTEWTLNNNIFLFEDKLYKQEKGTAMGACFAPNYANLFLGLWEELYIYSDLNPFKDKIVWWGRYIDDVILFFSGSQQELLDFHLYVNSLNDNLKLSLEHSCKTINFLDLKITKDDHGNLHTSIFRKATDRNTVLHADSFHPPWLIENIPYGQIQRLRRICNSDKDFISQSMNMQQRFIQRGYSPQLLNQAHNRALLSERTELLASKTKQPPTQKPYFVTRYSKEAAQIKHIIKRNWDIILSDPLLREVFPEPPGVSFKRAPTIKDKLVRSYLPAPRPKTWLSRQNGNFRCGHCRYCENMVKTDTFMDIVNNKAYKINGFINCNTTHVVYRLECTCGCFYVGLTKRRLRDRVAEHRYAIRTGNLNYPMAKHYIEAHHGSDCTLKVSGIEAITMDARGGDKIQLLKQREAYWIYALKATNFPGLNEDLDLSGFL